MKIFCIVFSITTTVLSFISILLLSQWLYLNGPVWACRLCGDPDGPGSFALVLGTLLSLGSVVLIFGIVLKEITDAPDSKKESH